MTTHLKWVGSKAQTAKQIVEAMPAAVRWVEPFCGSARTWLVAQKKYQFGLLADINQDLIDLYKWMQKDCDKLLDAASGWFTGHYNMPVYYYDFRCRFNDEPRGVIRSGLFLYLAWHSYNGLVRYNEKGQFNAPFGQYKRNPVLPVDGIRQMAASLPGVELVCVDWRRVLSSFLRPGDVVYCDPPYLPISKTSSFSAYMGTKFDEGAHEGLARAARRLAIRNFPVAISNADIEHTRRLYSDASQIHVFSVQRSVAPKASSRVRTNELLACYHPERPIMSN